MRKLNILYLLLLSLIACQNGAGDFKTSAESMVMDDMRGDMELQVPRTAEPPPPPPAPEETDEEQQIRNSIEKASKIIKDGNMRVEVNNLAAAKTNIDSTLKQFNAYYEDENYQSSDYRSSYFLIIRISAENFETFVQNIEDGKGKIKEKNIKARDVTDEYVDVAIRLNNNQTYLNRYRELLKKAKSIKEILEIQEKIRRIEEEIESRKGRLQYIDDKVRFSTLRLELVENHQVKFERKSRDFREQLTNAFRDGIDGFLDFLLFLVNIWPFLIGFAVLWYFRKRINWQFWKKR